MIFCHCLGNPVLSLLFIFFYNIINWDDNPLRSYLRLYDPDLNRISSSMEKGAKHTNGCQTNESDSAEAEKPRECVNGEDCSELNLLLPPPPKGGMSRKSEKTRRKVQWNDKNGNRLVEMLVFEPSDSDEEDNESCICTVT